MKRSEYAPGASLVLEPGESLVFEMLSTHDLKMFVRTPFINQSETSIVHSSL